MAACLLSASAAPAERLPRESAPIGDWLKAAGVPADGIGLVAVPVEGGPAIAAWNARIPLNPASSMKVVTTHAALSVLGPDYRWKTSVYLRGSLEDGVLRGDLVLRGGGDPKLVIEDVAELAARMRAAGLREIRGDLVVDDSIFAVGPEAGEAFDGDPSQPYNVRPYGALVNFKATRVVVRPDGAVARIALDPALADVEIRNEVKVVGGPCRFGAGGLTVRDAEGTGRAAIRVAGRYSAGCGEQSVFSAVLDHRQFVHGIFKAAWESAGGSLQGATRIERGAARGEPWIEWISPRTLADVTQDINKFSNNVMTRQVMLQIAAGGAAGPVTPERARAEVSAWLKGQGLDFPELVLDNGSGLSREERISAESLARVLVHAAASPHGDFLRLSLPAVGVDGTMKNRLVGEPVAGSAWIKTGSLADVRSIAGYVLASSGRMYAVVMMVNGPRAGGTRPIQDAFLRWVHANG